MPFSLGTVNFRLGADTSGLQRAVGDLQRIGRAVDAVANIQGAGARRVEAQMRRQEAAVTSALQRTMNLTNQMRRIGVDAGLIDRSHRALSMLAQQMGLTTLTAREFQRAQERFAAGLGSVQRQLVLARAGIHGMGGSTNALVGGMRDLASAAVLISGPLGGIAARISALSAVFNRSGAAMALFVAGFAGGAAAASTFSLQILQVARAHQQYQAILEASSTSQNAANSNLQFAIELANRSGQAISTLVPTWARFVASVRDTGVEGQKAREIFESFALVGSRLRIPQEEMKGIFRALDQMISKGQVFREELVQQLGDRFPGVLRLSAQAMGVTTAEFNKMVQAGQVMSDDFLPKLAATIRSTFGVELGQGIDNLEASMNRAQNAWSQFLLKVDESIGVSTAAKNALDALGGLLQQLTTNFSSVAASVAAFGAAIAVLAIPTIVTGIAALSRAVTSLALSFGALSAAMGANPLLAAAAALAGLTAAAVAAYGTFRSVKEAIDGIVLAEGEWINSQGQIVSALNKSNAVRNSINGVMESIEEATDRFASLDTAMVNQYITNTQAMVNAANTRTAALAQSLQLKLTELKEAQAAAGGYGDPNALGFDAFRSQALEAEIKAIEESLKRSQDFSTKLSQSLIQLKKGDLGFDRSKGNRPSGGGLADFLTGDLKGAKEDIRDLILEVRGLENVKRAIPGGLGAMLGAQDLEKAREMIRGMNSDELRALQQNFDALGIKGTTVDEQLQNLITRERELTTEINKFEQAQNKAGRASEKRAKELERQATADRKYMFELDQLQRRLDAMKEGPGALRLFDQQAQNEDKAMRFAESLRSAGFSAEFATQKYQEMLQVLAMTDAWNLANQAIQQFNEAAGRGIDSLGSFLVDSLVDMEFNFENFASTVKGIAKDLLNTLLQLAILNPLKNSLFGMGLPTFGGGGGLGGLLGFGGGAVVPGLYHNGGPIGRAHNGTLFGRGGGGGGGLRSDEQVIVAQSGERMMSRGDNDNLMRYVRTPRVAVQYIDQRRGGAPIQTQEETGPNGERVIKAFIRDEIKAQNEGTYGLSPRVARR